LALRLSLIPRRIAHPVLQLALHPALRLARHLARHLA
jgi:hypothetical protein